MVYLACFTQCLNSYSHVAPLAGVFDIAVLFTALTFTSHCIKMSYK